MVTLAEIQATGLPLTDHGAIAEALSASDSPSTTAIFGAQASEAATANDGAASTIYIGALALEIAVASDQSAGISVGIKNVSISEAANAADEPGAYLPPPPLNFDLGVELGLDAVIRQEGESLRQGLEQALKNDTTRMFGGMFR